MKVYIKPTLEEKPLHLEKLLGNISATADDQEGYMGCNCDHDISKCTCGDNCDCWGCGDF